MRKDSARRNEKALKSEVERLLALVTGKRDRRLLHPEGQGVWHSIPEYYCSGCCQELGVSGLGITGCHHHLLLQTPL